MNQQILVSEISFGYQYKPVLDQINMNVKKGSFFCIVGPNGSGKSTLLKVISSALKPQNGVVYIESKSVAEMNRKELAKSLSFVPQNTSLEFDFSVKDIVLMGRHPHIHKLRGETRKDVEIAEQSMKYTNTLHLAQRSFMELSGGERQRVILAQALCQEPDIILLDEPVSHLDLQHQVEILNLIKRMCVDKNLTAIAVLHDLNMASTYSDDIIMMKNGEILFRGTPFETLTVEHIREVFETPVYISVSPVSSRPYIYTLTKTIVEKKDIRIHLVCGGGSGGSLIPELSRNGFQLSCGVLGIGDLDWKLAKESDIEVAEEIPFAEISEAAYQRNKALAKAADLVVLTGLYFGKANVRNLELLTEADIAAKPLYILEDGSFAERDYTGGYGCELYERIKSNPNSRLTEVHCLYEEILKVGKTHEK